MSVISTTSSTGWAARLSGLSRSDRLLCGLLIGLALLALALGIVYGVAMALARSGAVAFPFETPYRVLTLHGTTAFFYWLYAAQAALLVVLAAGESGRRIALRPFVWRSEEHTSELQSLMRISYAVFCFEK